MTAMPGRWIDAYKRCMAEGRPQDAPFPLDYALEHLRIRRRRPFEAWMREELVIPEGKFTGGLYSPRTMPWVPPVLEAFSARAVKHLWLNAVPRSGKSLFGVGFGLCRSFEHGEALQVLTPKQETSSAFYTEKIERCITANPRLAALLPADYAVRSTHRHRIYLSNGGSIRNEFNPNNLNSYSAKVLIATEASKLGETEGESDVIELALERQREYPHRGMYIIESSPRRADCRFAKEVITGTNSRLEAPCPRCGVYFEPGRREQIVGWDVEQQEDIRAVLQCPHCKAELTDADRPAMWKAGRLVHANPHAVDLSVTVNWFWTDLRDLVELGQKEWLYRKNNDVNVLRDLLQQFYAVAVTDEDERLALDEVNITKPAILARCSHKYPRGKEPEEVVFYTAGIDVQKDFLYWLLLGFCADATIHVVDWYSNNIIPKNERGQRTATREEITATLDEALGMLEHYHPASVWVDCSFKAAKARDPQIITEWACKRGCRAIRGRAAHVLSTYKLTVEDRQLPPSMRDFMRVHRTPERREEWFLNVDRLKDVYRDRILRPKGTPGCVWFPKDTEGTSILNHYTAERPDTRTIRGETTNHWINPRASQRVDLWDCSIYALAGGLLRMAEEFTASPPARRKSMAELQREKRRGGGMAELLETNRRRR